MVESKFINEMTAVAEVRGEVKATRKAVIKNLTARFGKSSSHEKTISQISDLELLERMQDASFSVPSWDAILDVK